MMKRSLLALCTLGLTGFVGLSQTVMNEYVSLDDCILRALERNLEIRIARYLPEFAQLTLSGDYSAYDPNWQMSYQNSFRSSPGFAGIGQFNPPPNESDSQNYRVGIGGLLPTGLQYDLFTTINEQTGRQFNSTTGDLVEQPFFYTTGAGISLSQPLLRNFWIDAPRLTIRLNKRSLDQSELEVEFQIIQTATDVTVAYYDLIAAMENVRVQQTAQSLAERAWTENKMRVQVGAMAPLEEKQAEAQVKRSEADLISARQQLAVAQNTLKRLIHDDFASLQEVLFVPEESLTAVPEPFSKADSWQKGLTLRPDLISAQIEIEKQQLRLRFARNQIYPQLDLFGTYGLTGFSQDRLSPALGDIERRDLPNYSYGIRLNIPLTNRRARTDLKATRVQNERMLLDYKRLEQNVMVEIDNAIQAAQAALERVAATTAAREYAFQAWEAEKVRLEKGRSTTFVVLQLQRDLTAAESAEIQAKSDYNKFLARLAQAEGYTLRRLGVELEIEE